MSDCEHARSKIVDSRARSPKRKNGIGRYRRRECLECGERFTTHEFTEAELDALLERLRLAPNLLTATRELAEAVLMLVEEREEKGALQKVRHGA